MEWITLKEAARLVNKSSATIKRAIDKSNVNSTSNKLLNKKEPAKRGYTWYIEKSSLLKFYNIESNNLTNVKLNVELKGIIELLKSEVTEKNSQLKMEQERNKELQFMLAHAHKRIELLGAPKEKAKGKIGLPKISKILDRFGL